MVTFELSRGFDDDNCLPRHRLFCGLKNCHGHRKLRLNFTLTSKGHTSCAKLCNRIFLSSATSRDSSSYDTTSQYFLVFLLRKCQFVPSPLVTSILVHISPLSAAGNNGAITATGLVIVLTGFSARQPALLRFSRKLHVVQWLHAPLVFSTYVI
ncbi:Uncharacterized protein DBV15_02033 [Temnothorax longispinosus]|uniref:Uncharacterized protein n=1 Tax=Temnothorax longispinosus TaxID=300112 RepID=A0A4S2KJ39_9HYME|nr:Uncharacterized protein DBV15_02033 [Temnothorax longispinosus]